MDAKYPESQAFETWTADGLSYSLVRHSQLGHLCGYVRFPKRPTREEGSKGVLRYVPVHGGITYAHECGGEMVYGFDCAHAGDEDDGTMKNVEWARGECERMGAAIRAAAEIEEAYLLANSREEKVKILEAYRARMRGAGCNEGFNLGMAIAALCGEL